MDKKQLIATLGLDSDPFVSSLKESFSMLKTFTDEVKQQSRELLTYAKGLKVAVIEQVALLRSMTAGEILLKAVALGWKAVKIAMASTGIGLIVVALAALVTYLTTTQAGLDKLRKVTEPVVQVFGRLKGMLQNLGGTVFAGIAQMLNGEIAKGFKTLASGAQEAGKATVNAFTDGIKAGGKLADLTVKIEEAENSLILTRARLNRQIEESKEKAARQNITEKERAVFAKQGLALIAERLKLEDNVLSMQIEKMKLEQTANDTDREGYKDLNELIAKREELIERAAQQRTEFNSVVDSGNMKELAGIKAVNKEREKYIAIVANVKNPFDFEDKYSAETLGNIKEISDRLLNPALKGALSAGIIIPQEAIDRITFATEEQRKYNQEMAWAGTLTNMLGQTLQASFEAMVTNGKAGFRTLIDGIKALIIKLIAAAAAAFALNLLLGGLGMGGGTFGGMAGFKELFQGMAGLPKFAEGGMVTGMTTAILGDNPSGKEAIIPFEKMGSFLSKFGGGGGSGTQELYAVISGENIILSSNRYLQRVNKTIG